MMKDKRYIKPDVDAQKVFIGIASGIGYLIVLCLSSVVFYIAFKYEPVFTFCIVVSAVLGVAVKVFDWGKIWFDIKEKLKGHKLIKSIDEKKGEITIEI